MKCLTSVKHWSTTYITKFYVHFFRKYQIITAVSQLLIKKKKKKNQPQCQKIYLLICVPRIHTVWSESSLGTVWIAKYAIFLHVDNEDSNQAVWICRLIYSNQTVWTYRLIYSNQTARTCRLIYSNQTVSTYRLIYSNQTVWTYRLIYSNQTVWTYRLIYSNQIVWLCRLWTCRLICVFIGYMSEGVVSEIL